MSLPSFNTKILELSLMQSNWASILNPFIANPFLNGLLLKDVALSNGATTINHTLARMMQGWVITDINGAASIFRSKPFNALTLTLTSNAAVTVSLYVF